MMQSPNIRHHFLLLLAGSVLAGSGCAGGGREDPEAGVPGRAQYLYRCAACHGKSGLGSSSLFPPLAGTPYVNGPAEIPIRIVLHGLEGRLEVLGKEYMNVMPPLGNVLDDARIAEILTYTRGAWGNIGTPVTAEEVARVRLQTADRERSWTQPELEEILRSLQSAGPAEDPSAEETER